MSAADVFAALLRTHRLDLELTQEQLAQRSQVSARTVRDLERGAVAAPRASTAAALADALGLADQERERFLATAHSAVWAARRQRSGTATPDARADTDEPVPPVDPEPTGSGTGVPRPRTAAPDEPAPRFRILGPLTISHRGRETGVRGARQARLLATLLLDANTVVPRDRLVQALWDAPPDSMQQQVHNLVAGLRRTLAELAPEGRLSTEATGYLLTVPERLVDLGRFTDLMRQAGELEDSSASAAALALTQQALGLWRGAALSGIGTRYLARRAAVLDEQRAVAIERSIDLRMRLGERESLVSVLRLLVAENPYRESLRAMLMEVLHQVGRQADALAVFEEGRRLFADELGVDPGALLQRTYLKVLRDNPVENPVASTPDAGTAAAAGERDVYERRFLPRHNPEFTGRVEELEQLAALTRVERAGAPVISAIDGMGGVGKTTLAVCLAHRLSDEYPDGQYFLDLQGFSLYAQPLTPAQALGELLSEIGVAPELIPPDPSRRAAQWRARLAGQRVILLLDNALNAAQVRPLIPGNAEALVVITSRRRLSELEGAAPISLDVLPAEPAQALFRDVAGDDRIGDGNAELAVAVELCGRLPLAIRIAAARFRDRRTWTMAYLVEQLRDEHSRARFLAHGDQDVLMVLSVSYRQLAPAHQRAFRLLALHPGADFDAPAIAALTGVPLDEAELCLETLLDDNLLLQHVAGRYRLHDLIRDCARTLLSDADTEATVDAAQRRMLDYYLAAAGRWCRPWAKGFFKVGDEPDGAQGVPAPLSEGAAMKLLATEYQNFVAVTAQARKAGRHAHVWRMVCALQPFLALRNYGGEAAELFQSAIGSARSDGDRRAESACLTGLGMAQRARGSQAEAMATLRAAIDLNRDTGHRSDQAFQLNELGNTQLDDGDLRGAYQSFRQAYVVAHEVEEWVACAALANNLGVVARDLGRYDEALGYFRQALAIIPTPPSAIAVALTTINIGAVYFLRGEPARAITLIQEALTVLRRAEAELGQATALCTLSNVNRYLGDLPEALRHGRAALEMARRAEHGETECDALNTLGDVHVAAGDLVTAELTYLEGESVSREYHYARYIARSLEGLAHVSLARGDLADAGRLWKAAVRRYPTGYADADSARRHLAALADPTVRCLRCTVVGMAETGTGR